MKRALILPSAAVAALVLAGCQNGGGTSLPTVGFVQMNNNSTFDTAREGYVQGLADSGYVDGKTVKIDFKNAHGEAPTLQLIVKDFVSRRVNVIGTASTPALQAAVKSTKEIPIVFCMVVNPVAAGAGKSDQDHESNVTGVYNPVSVAASVKLVRQIMPDATRLGSLYDPGDTFTDAVRAMLQKAASENGFELTEVAAPSPNDVMAGVQALQAKGVQAIMQIPGVALYTAIDSEIKEAGKAKIPVFTVDPEHTKAGAVASLGWDFRQAGYEAGQRAARVLKGEKPAAMPLQPIQKEALGVNLDAARTLGIRIPDEVLKRATVTTGAKP